MNSNQRIDTGLYSVVQTDGRWDVSVREQLDALVKFYALEVDITEGFKEELAELTRTVLDNNPHLRPETIEEAYDRELIKQIWSEIVPLLKDETVAKIDDAKNRQAAIVNSISRVHGEVYKYCCRSEYDGDFLDSLVGMVKTKFLDSILSLIRPAGDDDD
ncbi:hypothetical protein TWF730_007377 [Orbilia blumenaviensis]|uniref:Uncharacterized protein n=1 Tax=Orbilia blumenaviensis TaxID=1796055 RepID=A0AAV9VAI6_9PEZI